ncbi:MaoC family dehydratase [Luteipulveratus halotolerans]|uniref:Dehydratase n=1 Tax=Luteipulveratus halotolerans TaxID=1631356 RepID=A0A0L6CF49_9MICO|nr:MaoC family dehydratase [Luteipulveratus halotolerans]KNX36319.1 dehydratase [Luteipulveratus halotolerans]
MRTFNGIDEAKAAVGEHLGYSDWHEVTQESVNLFADATGDHQWIHVDVDKAKAGPFGGTIAHGYLTLSLLPTLLAQIYTVEGVQMGMNYGANKVRFPSPVPVGSKVRAGAELLALEPASLGYQSSVKVTVEIEGADKPACVAEVLYLIVP